MTTFPTRKGISILISFLPADNESSYWLHKNPAAFSVCTTQSNAWNYVIVCFGVDTKSNTLPKVHIASHLDSFENIPLGLLKKHYNFINTPIRV